MSRAGVALRGKWDLLGKGALRRNIGPRGAREKGGERFRGENHYLEKVEVSRERKSLGTKAILRRELGPQDASQG